ncbi:MAG: DoxX family protein [Bdellovibrionales bacterium]|nr:DoxX family protein [Bdellovibrionales bacterium]
MTFTPTHLVQLIVALGIFNVWFLRSSLATPFRGGEARTLRDEFRAYGLNDSAFYAVGFLKIASASLLVAGLWFPLVTRPAALLLAALMVGALAMHLKVKDAPMKSLPALIMLSLSLWVSLG